MLNTLGWQTLNLYLLEKLTGSQLVEKFPPFYGTRRFITAFTSARHLSLSWASSIHSKPPHPTSWWYILILFSHLLSDLPSGLFFLRSPLQNPVHASPFLRTFYMLRPFHSSRSYHQNSNINTMPFQNNCSNINYCNSSFTLKVKVFIIYVLR